MPPHRNDRPNQKRLMRTRKNAERRAISAPRLMGLPRDRVRVLSHHQSDTRIGSAPNHRPTSTPD